MTGTRVLLVDEEAPRRDERLFELESQYGYLVTGCGTVREARDLLATREVHLVLSSATLGNSDAVALMRRINRDTADAPAVVILAQADEHGLRRLAWTEGADAVLTEPVDASELAAALKSVVESRSRRLAAVAAQKELAASLDHLADVLVLVLDAAVPGSASRGADLARLVTSLGAKFAMEVTLFDDLQRAARLHEVGRFTLGDAGMREPGVSPAGHCTMASASLLTQVPMLEGVADIIEKIGANWDGSGLPASVQRGQIPMRSRLLRVGVDLLATVERNALRGDGSLGNAAKELQAHTGIWYDPAVVAALNTMLAEEHPPQWHEDIAMVTFDRLAVGMRLAADLQTASGVKLLSDGAVLTATTLQLIRRRHEIDPLLLPVPIHQRTS